MIRVDLGDPRDPGPAALLGASHALMQATFPADANHYLSIDELCARHITFFVAREDATTLGTGALADRGTYGEIKAMFTSEAARGRGVAALILAALERAARAKGHTHLRLETGPELAAAIRLYQRHGFTFRGPFGDYAPDPRSVFMEKPLP